MSITIKQKMTKNLHTYIAGAVAVVLAGTMAYCSIDKSVRPMDFGNVKWCERDPKGRDEAALYSDFSKQYRIPESPANRKEFVQEVLLRNGGNLEKTRIMLPCNLKNPTQK